MKSPHAINQYVDNNQTIRFYLHLSKAYWTDRQLIWQHRSFWFRLNDRQVSLSPLGNFIYGNALGYLKDYLRSQPDSFYTHPEFTVYSPRCELNLKLYTYVHIDLDGVWATIEHCPFLVKDGAFHYQFRVNTHKPLDNEQVEKITRSAVESALYPQGLLRDIQLYFQCPKTSVAHHYRNFRYTQSMREALGYDSDVCHRAMLRRLRRKYNINLINSDPFDIQVDFHQATRYGRQTKPITVNARSWHISYRDIEEWCYAEGKEVDEDTIPEAFDALLEE